MNRYLAGVFAISEILTVLILGRILGDLTAKFTLQAFGIDIASLDQMAMASDPDLEAALVTGVLITSRFIWLLLFAFLILHYVHGITPRAAGVSRGGHSWTTLIGAGVLLFAFAWLPFKLVFLANEYFQFGEGLAAWRAWSSIEFSLAYFAFLLAGLLILPPLFEEPFSRGYMRVRLAKACGPITGVILAAVLFSLSHGHFYKDDAMVISVLAAVVFGTICWTWVAYRMNSVIPPMIAHSLGNIPTAMDTAVLWPTVAVMAVILALGFKIVRRELRAFLSELTEAPKGPLIFGLALIAAILLTIVNFGDLAIIIGVVALILTIIGWLPRMRRWDQRNNDSSRGMA